MKKKSDVVQRLYVLRRTEIGQRKNLKPAAVEEIFGPLAKQFPTKAKSCSQRTFFYLIPHLPVGRSIFLDSRRTVPIGPSHSVPWAVPRPLIRLSEIDFDKSIIRRVAVGPEVNLLLVKQRIK